jgi:hypothetical protein
MYVCASCQAVFATMPSDFPVEVTGYFIFTPRYLFNVLGIVSMVLQRLVVRMVTDSMRRWPSQKQEGVCLFVKARGASSPLPPPANLYMGSFPQHENVKHSPSKHMQFRSASRLRAHSTSNNVLHLRVKSILPFCSFSKNRTATLMLQNPSMTFRSDLDT